MEESTRAALVRLVDLTRDADSLVSELDQLVRQAEARDGQPGGRTSLTEEAVARLVERSSEIEMENRLAPARQQLTIARADEERLKRAWDQALLQARTWEHTAMAAVRSGNEDAALEASLRQKEAEDEACELECEWCLQREMVDGMERELGIYRSQIDAARFRRRIAAARQECQLITDRLSAVLADLSDPCGAAIETQERRLAQAGELLASARRSSLPLRQVLDEQSRSAEEWERKAELAVYAGDDELAREALARVKEHRDMADLVQPEWLLLVEEAMAQMEKQLLALGRQPIVPTAPRA